MNSNTRLKSINHNDLRNYASEHEAHNYSITLFVYGTLKRGYRNHDRYCRNTIDIRPATVWGRLYQLPAGYPALEVPEEHILTHGTSNPLADAVSQAHANTEIKTASSPLRPSGDWDLIHGELITLSEPFQDLAQIDRLEGFSPWNISLYQRVIIPVGFDAKRFHAWTYIMHNPSGGKRLHHGWWGNHSHASDQSKSAHIG